MVISPLIVFPAIWLLGRFISSVPIYVPLCPMGNRGRDVIDFLDGPGVQMINVQSDEKIPD